jgi:hypothetical protein
MGILRQCYSQLEVDGFLSAIIPLKRAASRNRTVSAFRAVPGNELIDGVFIDAARGWRAEAVEHCQFAMIQIRQPKY